MSSNRRGYVNDPDIFCCICGSVVPSVQRQNITSFVKKVYYAYFGIKLGDQDKAWAPPTLCVVVRQWSTGMQKSLVFGIPMLWSKPQVMWHLFMCW